MQISLRGLGDDGTLYPIGYDSMGNPIYPSGITAQQLVSAQTVPPVSSEMVVTPTSAFNVPVGSQPGDLVQPSSQYFNPVLSPASSAPSSMGPILLAAAVLAFIVLAK